MARHCEGGMTEAISQQKRLLLPLKKRYRNDVLNKARHCEGGTTEAISQQKKIAFPAEKAVSR